MEKIIKILATTKDGTVTGYSVFSDAGETGNRLIIKHADGVRYEFKDIGIKHAPDQMLVKRNGKNLEINFDVDGHEDEDVAPDLIIENYYEFGFSDIVGMGEDGKYYSYIPQEYQGSLEIEKLSEGSFSYQSLGESDSGFPIWVLGLGLAGLAGLSGSSGGGGEEENQPPVAVDDTDGVYEDDVDESGNDDLDPNTTIIAGSVLTNDSDPDGDTLSVTGHSGGDVYGALTLNPDGGYTYALDNTLVQYLADGEIVTEVYTYTIDDGNGGTDTATLTITITGTNDDPEVSATDVTGEVTEMGTPSGDITDSGSLTFTDVDITDTHSVSVVATSLTPLGILTPTINADTTGSGLGGVIDWTYTVPAASLEHLATGETEVETFTVRVVDNNGAYVDRTVTVTITGTNDDPEVSATDVTGEVTEMGTPLGNITDSGSLTFTDVDLTDIHSVSVTATSLTPLGILAPTINTDTTGSGLGGVIDWTYSVPAALVEYLAEGETKVETFTVTLDDGEGGTLDRTITVTINGTNDAPVITVVPADDSASASFNETNATLSVSDTLTLGDIDTTDIVTVAKLDTLNIGGTYAGTLPTEAALKAMFSVSGSLDGTQQYDLNGITWTFASDTEHFDFLAVGETLVLTYQVQATDDSGTANNISNIQDITITITGTNDDPVATANTNNIGNENAGTVSGNAITDDNGFGVDSDADLSDTLTVSAIRTGAEGGSGTSGTVDGSTQLAGTYGWLTINTDGTYSYDVDNTNPTVSGLTGTDTLTETYTYTVSDGHGGTDIAEIVITISDDNDAPVAINDVNSITEDIVSVSGDVTDGTPGQDYDPKPPFDTFTVTGADDGVHTNTSGNIDTTITGLYGTLVIQSDGSYIYMLDNTDPDVQGLSVGETLTDTFSYTITDTFGAHDTAQLDITINGADDGVTVVVNDPNGASAGDITVEEKALDGVATPPPYEGTDSTLTTETTTGTFVITAPDGLGHITVDGTNVTLAQLDGATSGSPVDVTVTNGTMSITDYDSATGVVSYSYTLTSPATTTPSANDGVTTIVKSIVITAEDDDGSTGSDNMGIGIVDDVPAPPVYDLDLEPAPINTNLLITFDISGSMDWASGVAGLSRLELAKLAVMEMIYQYEELGDVRIQAVLFSGSASYASDWMTISEAESYLNSVTAGGSTNYDAALAAAQSAFGTTGKLTTDAQNIGYFFSDGEPTSGNGSIGIDGTEEVAWETFLSGNDIKSYAVGLGTGVSAAALEPIAYDGIAGSEMSAIVVDDLSTLSSTLSATVPPPTQYLDLSGGVDDNFFGADGGYLSSVGFDGGHL